jgi:hypothetical protein
MRFCLQKLKLFSVFFKKALKKISKKKKAVFLYIKMKK